MSSTSNRRFNDFQKQLISSAVGSATASILLSPITIVKVRLQSLINTKSSARIIDVIRTVHRNEGYIGFWNGYRTALLQSLPSSMIYMVSYEKLKKEMNASMSPSSPYLHYVPAFGAAIARMISVTCVAPLELIRTIQAGGIDKSIRGIVRDIIQQTGVKGLYRGWSSTLMRDVPYSSLYWFSFEALKPLYQSVIVDKNEKECNSSLSTSASLSLSTFLAGATAGCAAAVITHPFDVLKTYTQLEHIELDPKMTCDVHQVTVSQKTGSVVVSASSGNTSIPVDCVLNEVNAGTRVIEPPVPLTVTQRIANTFKSLSFYRNEQKCCINSTRCTSNNTFLFVVSKIYREHGIVNGLYRGLSMRLMMVIPGGAIMVTIYETVKRYL